MKHRSVRLQYQFADLPQDGSSVENPLFDMLAAVAREGSIQGAAKHMGLSYRHLWGSLREWEAALDESLITWVRGQPARLTPFAERLLWAERRARVRLQPHIEALRSELRRVLDEALDGDMHVLRVDASHDLLLPRLQQQAAERGLHIELRFTGSLDALRSLAEGRCLVAGFHVPPMGRAEHYAQALRAHLQPGRHKLLGTMKRTQGLMVAAGNPLRISGFQDVVAQGLRFVGREEGSGTHLLTQHLLDREGLDAASLHRVSQEVSHLAAATAVASGRGDVALGVEAAALRLGLDFLPLVQEDYFLACLSDALETPAVVKLRHCLGRAPWQQLLESTAGYAPADDPGDVLSLTRSLPWWHYRSPKADSGA